MNKTNSKILESLPKSKKSSKSNIPVLEDLPEHIQEEIDTFVEESNAEKYAKSAADVSKKSILNHMDTIIDKHGEAGNYQKSFKLTGKKQEVTFTKAARFSFSEGTTPATLAKIVGKKFVDDNFNEEISLAVNPEVLEDEKKSNLLLRRLVKAFGDELGDFFVKETKLVTRKDTDLAANMYDLPKSKRYKLKEEVVQGKAGLRG